MRCVRDLRACASAQRIQLGFAAAVFAAGACLALCLGRAAFAPADQARTAAVADEDATALQHAAERLREALRLRPADGFYLSGEPVPGGGAGILGIIRKAWRQAETVATREKGSDRAETGAETETGAKTKTEAGTGTGTGPERETNQERGGDRNRLGIHQERERERERKRARSMEPR